MLEFYRYTAEGFLSWLEGRGITAPPEIQAMYVREYLVELTGDGKSDNTIHNNALAIRNLLWFWRSENYMPALVTFALPKVAKKKLPCLTAQDLRKVFAVCKNPLDKTITLFLADSWLRRSEAIALDWKHVRITAGFFVC
jgi:site-specific recombinase XerD